MTTQTVAPNATGTIPPGPALNQGGEQDRSVTANEETENVQLKRLLDDNLKYFNQKQWQQVVETSSQILASKPFTEPALINRSAAYTELGKYTLAITDTNTLIIMNKKNGVAFNNRAYAYEKAGFLEKSIVDYGTACKLGIQQSCNDVQRLKRLMETSE